MGRVATISKGDVSNARNSLRQDGLPHGISAIRNYLSRGSPQLISRLLGELDSVQTKNEITRPADLQNAVTLRMFGMLEQQVKDARGAITEKETYIEQLRDVIVALERRVTSAEAQNSLFAATVKTLQRELEAQRQLFDTSRRDHVRDRALLATRIELLGISMDGAKRRPGTMKTATAGQLDLYRDPDFD